MSETAKEFLKSASSVPQNYRSTVGVVSILQKTIDGNYEICFYFNFSFCDDVIRLKYSTNVSDDFLQKVSVCEPSIDSFIDRMNMLDDSATRILVEDIDESTCRCNLRKYISKAFPLTVGSNSLSVAEYKGKRVCFVDNFHEDIHFIVYLDEDVYNKLRNLHQEYSNIERDFIDFLKNSGFKTL